MDKVKLKSRILTEPEGFISYLQELINANRIEDKVALGIAQFTIANDPEKLSEKQMYVLIEKGILPYNYADDCERCAVNIPWSEMLGATYIYEDGLCSYCHHIQEKIDKS